MDAGTTLRSEDHIDSGKKKFGLRTHINKSHHQPTRSSVRLAVAAVNLSGPGSSWAHTRSMAWVISAVAWRAKYSLTASLNNWFRDFPVRRARRSTAWNRSSETDIVVFYTVLA